jgi:predicted DNA-binding transcriptional regulator YafY
MLTPAVSDPGYGWGVRADRLVSLALLLQARGRMSAHALAGELEVSVRTVYRDIAALNAAGVPVLAEPGPGGGCRLIEGYRFPLRGLSADEAEALLLLGVPAAVAELGLADALAAAHRKVSTSAGLSTGDRTGGGEGDGAGHGPGRPASLVHLDLPRWFHSGEPAPHLRTLAAAVRQGRPLLLGYRRDDDSPEKTRAVGPLGLVNKAGTWYLVATRAASDEHPAGRERPAGREHQVSRERGAGRDDDPVVFRVGRVTSARPLPGTVARPDGFDLAAFWARWSAAFMTTLSRVEVRVRATAAALAIFPVVFGDAGRRAADAAGPAGPDGLREVRLTFEGERAAAHQLAGFGGEIAVISPAAVRAGLVATARELLARYGELRIRRAWPSAARAHDHHPERVRASPLAHPAPLGDGGGKSTPNPFGILQNFADVDRKPQTTSARGRATNHQTRPRVRRYTGRIG